MLYAKVEEYCKKHNMTIAAFEKKCELGNGTVGKWKTNGITPTLSTLERISEKTGVPVKKWIS